MPPMDQRGKHSNIPQSFSQCKNDGIINHIRSFSGQQPQYTLKDSRKFYLPENLNICKMHTIYLESHLGKKCIFYHLQV